MTLQKILGFKPVSLAAKSLTKTILVVDDTFETRDYLEQLLTGAGLKVVSAASGNEALVLLCREPIDLLLTDTRMPKMDGIELIRQVRGLFQQESLPIIAVSASAFHKDRKQLLSVGADCFLAKPFDVSEIFSSLSRLLDIEFNYESPPSQQQELTSAEIIIQLKSLPSDQLTDFANNIRDLLMEKVEQQIQHIDRLNKPLGQALAQFASQFKYSQLLEFVQLASQAGDEES